MCVQDEECRCYSDSFMELPKKEEVVEGAEQLAAADRSVNSSSTSIYTVIHLFILPSAGIEDDIKTNCIY